MSVDHQFDMPNGVDMDIFESKKRNQRFKKLDETENLDEPSRVSDVSFDAAHGSALKTDQSRISSVSFVGDQSSKLVD